MKALTIPLNKIILDHVYMLHMTNKWNKSAEEVKLSKLVGPSGVKHKTDKGYVCKIGMYIPPINEINEKRQWSCESE